MTLASRGGRRLRRFPLREWNAPATASSRSSATRSSPPRRQKPSSGWTSMRWRITGARDSGTSSPRPCSAHRRRCACPAMFPGVRPQLLASREYAELEWRRRVTPRGAGCGDAAVGVDAQKAGELAARFCMSGVELAALVARLARTRAGLSGNGHTAPRSPPPPGSRGRPVVLPSARVDEEWGFGGSTGGAGSRPCSPASPAPARRSPPR